MYEGLKYLLYIFFYLLYIFFILLYYMKLNDIGELDNIDELNNHLYHQNLESSLPQPNSFKSVLDNLPENLIGSEDNFSEVSNIESNIVIPLIYSIIENHGYENIILIHDKINDSQQFALYANSKSVSIIYNSSSSNDELIVFLNKYFTNIKRIAFVFHNANIDGLKEFTNNKPLFDYSDLEINTIEYSLNMKFIIDVANQFNVENLDYLACNTLLHEHWNKYFNILKEKTSATIGASNDETGNIKYGGNWLLENNNEDIRNIYFTSKTCTVCGNKKEDLGGNKVYSCEKCNLTTKRDYNGCRNIFLSCIKSIN